MPAQRARTSPTTRSDDERLSPKDKSPRTDKLTANLKRGADKSPRTDKLTANLKRGADNAARTTSGADAGAQPGGPL